MRYILFTLLLLSSSTSFAQSLDVWIGTGRSELSKGIYHCSLDTQSGKLSQPKLVAEMNGRAFSNDIPRYRFCMQLANSTASRSWRHLQSSNQASRLFSRRSCSNPSAMVVPRMSHSTRRAARS